MKGPDGRLHVAAGVYRELVPPRRLAFTWDWEEPSSRVGDTLVTVDFVDAGDGSTDVILSHSRFDRAEQAGGHERGWTQLLNIIERYLDASREARP